MLFRADGVLRVDELFKPDLLFLARDGVVHLCRRRAGTRGENKGEERVELRLFYKIDSLHRFGLGLSREADNDVAREHHLRHDAPRVGDHFLVLCARVGAVHRLQNAVAPGLDGEVELLCNVLAARHRVEKFVGRVLRLARHKAQPVVAGNGVDGGEQVCKVVIGAQVLAVAVHVLAEEGDLLVALGDETAALLDDLLRLAAALAAADVGHDAVRAEVIAPVHDAHPRAHAALAHDGKILCDAAVLILNGEDALILRIYLVQQLGEPPLGLRAEHKVYVVVGVFHLVGHDLLLRHAAAEADDLIGLCGLRVAESAKVAIYPLFRVLADGAGVEQDHVRLLLVARELIAHLAQHTHEHLAVGHVLLAAEGVDQRKRRTGAAVIHLAHLARKFLLTRELLLADDDFFAFQGMFPPESR